MYHFDLIDPQFLPHASCEFHLSLKAGECHVIVGENGVGKSTLARRLRDHIHPHAVLIPQFPLEHFYDREVGNLKKYFLKSAGDLLDVNLFERIWRDFGLHEKENRLISQLSGGEEQSLKLILNLGLKAPMFILDEPSQFLDTHRKQVLWSAIQEKINPTVAVVIIEHDLGWLPKNLFVSKVENISGTIKVGQTWTT